ncbi:uncharacterized protein PAF06_020195 [Gastrophryne carolinensis]
MGMSNSSNVWCNVGASLGSSLSFCSTRTPDIQMPSIQFKLTEILVKFNKNSNLNTVILVEDMAGVTQNATGSLDEDGVCHCTIVLPDSTFPADQLESLEISNHNLTVVVEKEITKIHIYESTLTVYLEQLKNLTKRVEVMEMGHLSYTELDFELLKLEIREMEALILQLKTSLNGTNVIVETLYWEIRNISIIVSQLEIYDKNNVLLIRREIESLKKRLEDCEKNQTKPSQPSVPPEDYGTCEHGQITAVSKPFVVQLNWAGANYKYGGWGRDSYLGGNQEAHWIALQATDGRLISELRFYPTYNRLLLYSHSAAKTFSSSDYGQGAGMIVYNGSMYYNCYNTRNLCKLNTTTYAVERMELANAAYNNRFSYSLSPWQDIDFAGDENGLWVIYATEESAGNIVISKINPAHFVVEQTWQTTQYKSSVTNAFMACGVLYATRALSTKREEIFYSYDTKTVSLISSLQILYPSSSSPVIQPKSSLKTSLSMAVELVTAGSISHFQTLAQMRDIKIVPINWSDHDGLLLNLNSLHSRLSSFLWSLNSSLLSDPVLVKSIEESLVEYFDINATSDVSTTICWEAHKPTIRGRLIQLASKKKTERNAYIDKLEMEYLDLTEKAKRRFSKEIRLELDRVTRDLNLALAGKAENSIRWLKHKYYYKVNKPDSLLAKKLKTPEQHYRPIRLRNHFRDLLDRDFGVEEVKKVISGLKLNKRPGPGGFTGAYYKTFSSVLAPRLTAVFNAIRKDPVLVKSIEESLVEYFDINATSDVSTTICWEAHKPTIRGRLIQLASKKKTERNAYIDKLEKEYLDLTEKAKRRFSKEIRLELDRVTRDLNLALADHFRDLLDRDFGVEEVKKVISGLKLNKRPGPGGFTGVYYKTFSSVLAPRLTAVFNAIRKVWWALFRFKGKDFQVMDILCTLNCGDFNKMLVVEYGTSYDIKLVSSFLDNLENLGNKIGLQDTSKKESVSWRIPYESLSPQMRHKALIRLLMKRLHNATRYIEEEPGSGDDSDVSSEEDVPVMGNCAWLVARNATGVLSGKDHCVCEVLLPDSSFPAKRVGALEDETLRLSNKVEDEMNKLEEQDIRLDAFLEKLTNLSKRLDRLEKLRPDELKEINFELLKKEVKEMELAISAMRGKNTANNGQVETLYKEVKEISKTVGQLETLDRNNVLKTQRDMESLKKRLVDCEKDIKAKPVAAVPLGSCQHHGLARVGPANLLQLNWKGSSYKSGAWGKDSAWNTTKKSMYWVGPLNTDGRILESVRMYPTLSDLQMYKNFVDLPLSVLIKNKWNHTLAGQGAGMIVHNSNLYYNCYNSHDMCRAGLTSGLYQRKPISNALFNNRYSYSGSMYQDIIFASDEKGLYVSYTTEESAGNIVVGKVNVATFTVESSWTTTQYKPGVSSTFMICGVLYATRSLGPKTEEIFYMFDTKTGKEGRMSIMMEKAAEKVHSLSYNSNERKLFMFNEGYLLHYDVFLKP